MNIEHIINIDRNFSQKNVYDDMLSSYRWAISSITSSHSIHKNSHNIKKKRNHSAIPPIITFRKWNSINLEIYCDAYAHSLSKRAGRAAGGGRRLSSHPPHQQVLYFHINWNCTYVWNKYLSIYLSVYMYIKCNNNKI